MDTLQTAIIASFLAGAMIPLGGAIARLKWIGSDWMEEEYRHTIVAFGGGVLVAAVALVLVPRGTESLSAVPALAAFLLGGVAFFLLDRLISLKVGPSAQLIATVSDFVPEAIALGAMFASGGEAAPLLAVLIGLQNLPEGFNAFREQQAAARHSDRRILGYFCALALLGPAAAVLGHLVLGAYPALLGAMMLFAGGGILYLTFQDIAPQSHLERAWAPALGAVAGFAFALGGDMLVGG